VTDALTHAITVPQPLAWAAAAGYCPVLMSDTRPPMEREGQVIGIHASKASPATIPCECGCGVYRNDWPGRALRIDVPAHLAFGALIGVARLVGVVRRVHAMGPGQTPDFEALIGRSVPQSLDAATCTTLRPWWRSGSKWGLLLTDAVLLPEPIPMRGAGGVWFIPSSNPLAPSELAGRALEQWRKARGA
jgi:hypothetical protein